MFPATDTFSTLIDETLLALTGFGLNEDQFTVTTSDLNTTGTTFSVADPDGVGKGLCEIGDELVMVSSVVNNQVSVAQRGWRGTAATTHASGEIVNYKPTWPRSVIARAINDSIVGVYPTLFGVAATEITPDVNTLQYVCPSTTERILAVEQRSPVAVDWQKLNQWELSFNGNTTDFSTGVSVTLPGIATLGVVRIWRAFRPVALTSTTQPFTDTGLPASAKEVIVLAACSRLVGWLDVGRLPTTSVESDALTQNRPLGSAIQAARDINAKFQLRLQEEQRALELRFPARIHAIRR